MSLFRISTAANEKHTRGTLSIDFFTHLLDMADLGESGVHLLNGRQLAEQLDNAGIRNGCLVLLFLPVVCVGDCFQSLTRQGLLQMHSTVPIW